MYIDNFCHINFLFEFCIIFSIMSFVKLMTMHQVVHLVYILRLDLSAQVNVKLCYLPLFWKLQMEFGTTWICHCHKNIFGSTFLHFQLWHIMFYFWLTVMIWLNWAPVSVFALVNWRNFILVIIIFIVVVWCHFIFSFSIQAWHYQLDLGVEQHKIHNFTPSVPPNNLCNQGNIPEHSHWCQKYAPIIIISTMQKWMTCPKKYNRGPYMPCVSVYMRSHQCSMSGCWFINTCTRQKPIGERCLIANAKTWNLTSNPHSHQ